MVFILEKSKTSSTPKVSELEKQIKKTEDEIKQSNSKIKDLEEKLKKQENLVSHPTNDNFTQRVRYLYLAFLE